MNRENLFYTLALAAMAKQADFDGAGEGPPGGGGGPPGPFGGPAVDSAAPHMSASHAHPPHPGKSCQEFDAASSTGKPPGNFPGKPPGKPPGNFQDNPKEERGNTPEAEGQEQRESAHNANLR